jgi:TusA-related sulfurtransferase
MFRGLGNLSLLDMQVIKTILDLSGELCPIPIIKARRALDKMKDGDVLEIIIGGENWHDSYINIYILATELGMEIPRKIKRDEDGKLHIPITKKQE